MTSDLINLDELTSLYGEESVKELLDMSIKEADALIATLKVAVPAQNAEAVAADAHQLKGMSATMTMRSLSELAYKLEMAAKSRSWQGSAEILAEIEARYAEIQKVLNR